MAKGFHGNHTEDAKRRIGLAHKGKHLSDETKRKMSESISGKIISEETKTRMSQSSIGISKSENHKKSLSISHIKYPGKNNFDRLLQRKYGISEEKYLAMLQGQNNECAICHRSETLKLKKGTARRLCIDHDHKTGKVRGLLCWKCNTDLGIWESRNTDCIEYINKYG